MRQAAAEERLIRNPPPLVDFETMPEMFSNHAGQKEAWEATEPIIGIFAGWQSGKTTIAPPWLMRDIQRRGPGDYALAAPSNPILRKKVLPELLRFLRSKLKPEKDWIFKRADMEIHITAQGGLRIWGKPEEACIYLVHTDSELAVEAFTAKAMAIDEPGHIPDKEIWEGLQARVAVKGGRILLTGRPVTANWYVTEIWDKRKIDPRIKCVNFRSCDNPEFSQAEYDRQQKLLPEWRFKMKYQGIPTRPAGAVFDCFEREFSDKQVRIDDRNIENTGKNTCNRFEIPKGWRKMSGHDFGLVNMAAVFLAQDPVTCKYYAYQSYRPGSKAGNRTIREHVAQFWHRAGIEKKPGFKPNAWGGAKSEGKIRIDFAKNGWPISEPPVWELLEGIDRLFSLLKSGTLVIFNDLTDLIDEIESYAWEIDENDEPIAGKIVKKETFHRLDALRYICASIYEGVAEELEVVDRYETPEDAAETLEFLTEEEVAAIEALEDEEQEERYNAFEHLGWD